MWKCLAGTTLEQPLDRGSLPRTKFGTTEEPQHTTHTQNTQSQDHTHIHTQAGGTAAADGETILATLKHGSHTRLHVFKPVRYLYKENRIESSHSFNTEVQTLLFLASSLHVDLAKLTDLLVLV